MGKKRKAHRASEPSGPKEVDPADARLAINSYEDIADSEDEYYMEKDRIDFNEQPRTKRQRREEEEDEFLEPSDEEIFEEDEDMSDEEGEGTSSTKKKGAKSQAADLEDSGAEDDEEEEEGDSGWWGSSKQVYYNADTIETEGDALEEEAEALRLQKKKLFKMADEDFMFDESEWLAPAAEGVQGDDVVTEVLKDAVVTEDMTPEERYKVLQSRYPEFDYLADEFRTLQPMHEILQKEADGKPTRSLSVIKYWVLSAYISALASYFAILTSPARDDDGTAKTLDPAELRDHEIMETLVSCREAWVRVQSFKPATKLSSATGILSPPEEGSLSPEPVAPVKKTSQEKAQAKARKAKAKKAKEIEASLADLDQLLDKPKKIKQKSDSKSSVTAAGDFDDNRSDFGEEEELDAKTAVAKAQKKKSLRFYTSQIVQKAAKRADAGRDAGGDMDIPYRERHKDREARLNAEAEKRGQKDSKHGAALDDNSSGEEDVDHQGKPKQDDDDDEYYDMVANRASAKRADKAARFEALAAAKKGERVVDQETVDEDGKRKITYQIEKNKGLAPHRKKDVRNPRVKKRKMYEAKKKKLASMRPTYKGGEGAGGYKGELSGIKTGVVKSIKL